MGVRSRDLKLAAKRPLRAISLFTGAGGLDYGLEKAGFETAVAVEMDADCCQTLRASRPWPVIEDRIENVTSGALLSTGWGGKGDVDLLHGGPPCQPFSKSSYWVNGDARRLSDPRAQTLWEYMRCVRDLCPAVFLLENVHGISYSGKEEGFRLLLDLTKAINTETGTSYRLSWQVLNTADYGVPQARTRFFLVGDREGRSFSFPSPTHTEATTGEVDQPTLLTLPPHVTAWDAIGDLDDTPLSSSLEVGGWWGDLLPSIPEGENYLWHTNRKGGLPLFGWRTRYWSFLLKLAKNRPSWTIQAQPGSAIGPFHWRNRRLSVREMARIQTFPDDIHVVGGRTSAQRQLGNAVPSLMAEILGRALADQLFGRPPAYALQLAVPDRHPVPPPEPLAEVPSRYLHMVGEHPDHPGTGAGARAVARAPR